MGFYHKISALSITCVVAKVGSAAISGFSGDKSLENFVDAQAPSILSIGTFVSAITSPGSSTGNFVAIPSALAAAYFSPDLMPSGFPDYAVKTIQVGIGLGGTLASIRRIGIDALNDNLWDGW